MTTSNSQSTLIPLEELECYRDAEWAMYDPEVQRVYNGKWVVAHKRRIIAQGKTPQEVVLQAGAIVSGLRHLAVFCVVEDPSHAVVPAH